MYAETLLQDFLKAVEKASSKKEIQDSLNHLILQLEEQKEEDRKTYEYFLNHQEVREEPVDYTKDQNRCITISKGFVVLSLLSYFWSFPIFVLSFIAATGFTLAVPVMGIFENRKRRKFSSIKEKKINVLRNASMYKEKVELLEKLIHELKQISLDQPIGEKGNQLLELLKQEKERLNSIYVENDPDVKYFQKQLNS